MQTRTALLEAGKRVFAEKGVDAATIQDITETADVGRGSFYNFFDTKEDLVEALVAEILEDLRVLEGPIEGIDDPAVALATLLRYGHRFTSSDPIIGWFVLRTRPIGGLLDTRYHENLTALIERGIREKRFDVPSAELGYTMLIGMLTTSLEARLLGRLPETAADHVIEYVLRMLGVSEKEATKIMALPLPPLEPSSAARG